jgi:integrase
MASEKKFFPVLYPLDRDIRKQWFISYKVEDWTNGGLAKKKYTGLLNRLPTAAQRISKAKEYMDMMQKGEPLPDYQGMREVPVNALTNKQTTNIISCCKRWYNLRVAEGKKPATIAQNKSKLHVFYKWLVSNNLHNLAIGAIDDTHALEYIAYLTTEKKLAATTINHHKALLANVWDLYKKKLKENPWREIKNKPKRTKHLDSYPMYLKQCINENLPVYDQQLWIFLQCIYYCAIRPQSELRFLRIENIDFEQSTIKVPAEFSKNGKERIVVVYNKLLEQMKAIGYDHAKPYHYIFSYYGLPGEKRVGKNYFIRRWDDFREAFNIPKQYKLYGSKHTGGQALAIKTNTYIVQEHMDHTDPKTTQHYTGDLPKEHLRFLVKEYPEFYPVIVPSNSE